MCSRLRLPTSFTQLGSPLFDWYPATSYSRTAAVLSSWTSRTAALCPHRPVAPRSNPIPALLRTTTLGDCGISKLTEAAAGALGSEPGQQVRAMTPQPQPLQVA